jgi:ABC-type transport system involved in multi-copper enzyme maturation permease subunit
VTTAAIKVTQTRVMTSEWIKLRSLRSSVLTLVATFAMIVVPGVLFCIFQPAHGVVGDPTGLSLRGTYLAQLAIGVLGVLLVTGEYSTGMIRATICSVPRRLPVLWAKLGVFALVSIATTTAAAFIAFLGGQAALSAHHIAGASLSDPAVLRAVFGAGLALTVVGLLGMALGFIIRNTAGAVAVLFGLLIILPVVAQALPTSWFPHIYPYLPNQAGQAIMQVHGGALFLAPWTGLGVFAAYAAALIALGALLLRRRDA